MDQSTSQDGDPHLAMTGELTDGQSHHLPAFLPKLTAKGVLVVAAEVPDDLLQIGRQVMDFL